MFLVNVSMGEFTGGSHTAVCAGYTSPQDWSDSLHLAISQEGGHQEAAIYRRTQISHMEELGERTVLN